MGQCLPEQKMIKFGVGVRGGSGVHGQNNTQHYYLPVKIPGWDPVANNGIKVFVVAGYTSNVHVLIY